MRDPKRIDRMLAKLAEAWKLHPDLRLGQLIANLASDPETGAVSSGSIFQREDDKMEQDIDGWLAWSKGEVER